MRVERSFHRSDVVKRLEIIDENLLAQILEAVPNEFELTEEQREGVLEAMQSVDAGHYVEHAEVMKWVQSWGTPNELPKPQCQ